MTNQQYALITAAYNEANYIARTIESVVAQTIRPVRWVIISDASTDSTDDIVKQYAERYSFIHYLRITEDHIRIPAAQVHAFNAGYRLLENVDYALIGNLDGDVSFDPGYFEDLLLMFERNPRLGLAGGVLTEQGKGFRKPLRGEALRNVCQAVQLFRRECYEAIGGYPPFRYGASDTYMEVKARMLGWEVESYPDLVICHNRYTASASGLLRGRLRQGCADFYVGTHPLFEIARCARRWSEKPPLLGMVLRMAAFFYLYLIRRPAVPKDFVQFYRAEQLGRLRAWLSLASTSPLR